MAADSSEPSAVSRTGFCAFVVILAAEIHTKVRLGLRAADSERNFRSRTALPEEAIKTEFIALQKAA